MFFNTFAASQPNYTLIFFQEHPNRKQFIKQFNLILQKSIYLQKLSQISPFFMIGFLSMKQKLISYFLTSNYFFKFVVKLFFHKILCLINYLFIGMKTLLIFIFAWFASCSERRIVARPVQTTYNQYGGLEQILIQFKAYQAIYPHDLFKITFPQTIHNTATNLYYSIMTSAFYSIVDRQLSLPVSTVTYYFQAKTELQAEIWYIINIEVDRQPAISFGLIQIEVVSDSSGTNQIRRCWNQGFQYYHIENAATPEFNVLTIQLLTTTLIYKPSARYSAYISIQSTIQSLQSTEIQIGFIDPSVNTSSLPSLLGMQNSGNGFIFTGYCDSICNRISGYNCIHSQKCAVQETKLTVTLPYLKIGEKYLIQAYIINPTYASETRIEAFWKGNNQMALATGFSQNLLKVYEIAINPQQINLLWGIPYDTVVNGMGLGLFVNNATAQSNSLSSFDIGFSVADYSPIQSKYEVRINIGAQSVLQSSINHNLPIFTSNDNIVCKYILPEIVCTGVSAFTKKNYRYYIRAKGYFLTSSNVGAFGDISIILQEFPSQTIFTPLVRNLNIVTITSSDYHDYNGIHSGNQNVRIRQTIISSHKDTLLDNTTSNSVSDLLFGSKGFAGIDPSVNPLQLNFFIDVGIDKMSQPTPTNFNQKYQMYLFANPNIMNVSKKGLDIQAYSSTTKQWNVQNLPCYVDSSTTATMQIFQCQKYDDHVFDQQKYNNYISHQYYHKYQWICGNAGANEVWCGSSDCSSDCQIFRGNFDHDPTSMADGQAGILSIRNVSFVRDYQASEKSSEKDLDFVIAFYQDGVFISASLINGYTLNSTRLDNLKAEIINNYNDNSVTNEGQRGPTLLKISGNLTLTEVGSSIISSISVYLPDTLTIQNFVQRNNYNKIGCLTKKCTGYIGGLPLSYDVWTQQQKIQISNLPALTQNFDFLIPVVYKNYEPVYSITVKLNLISGASRGVFRMNGSVVQESLFDVPNHLADQWSPTINWNPNLQQWVQNGAYQYKQSINIAAMQLYQPAIQITMGSTTMPTLDLKPTCTFSTAQVNIFSNFSQITINNGQKCIGPFQYVYKDLYSIWSFVCPISVGSINEIVIGYPYYLNILGGGFPFSEIFTYQYSNSDGQMIGYRVQQTSAYTPQSCVTIKNSQYYLQMTTSQQNVFKITLPPIQLNPLHRNKLKIKVSFPIQVLFNYVSCKAQQTSSNIALLCAFDSQTGSNVQVIVSNPLQSSINVNEINLIVKTVKNGVSTVSSIPPYSIDLYLPMTDSSNNSASLDGDIFVPFASHFSSCTNSFSTSTQLPFNQIELSEPQLLAISSQYYGSVKFMADFSDFRSTFFTTSVIVITFSSAVLTDYTRCWFDPESSFWDTYSIDATYKIYKLYPSQDIIDFTATTYSIQCSNIITTGATFTASVKWQDSGVVAQTSIQSLSFSHSLINNVVTTASGSLTSKSYNTNFYLAEYLLNLTLATTTDDSLDIRISFPFSNIHKNFLECETLKGSWSPIFCYPSARDSVEEVRIQMIGNQGSYLQLKIYGVPQQKKLVNSNIKILVKKTAMSTLTSTYFVYTIADQLPSTISNSPIIITHLAVDSSQIVTINYSLPGAHSSNFYIQIDQLFTLPYTFTINTNFICLINSTKVSCQRVRPNLIKVVSTLTHLAKQNNQLTFGPLPLSSKLEYDPEFVYFRMFTVSSSTATSVIMGSHLHLESYLPKTAVVPDTDFLLWKLENSQIPCHFVYVGYYRSPAKIVSSSGSSFVQSFNISLISPTTHSLTFNDLQVDLGTSFNEVYIGAQNLSSLGFSFLQFSHTNTNYPTIESLPIYVSNDKCMLSTQYDEYNIFKLGQTIPIVINASLCRPIYPMEMIVSVDTQYIQSNQQLTTRYITSQTQLIYIVLNHPQDTDVTLNKNYVLSISFISNNSFTQNSYDSVPAVTIHVISKDKVIGNPEGKQPDVNQIGSSYIDLTLECNSPSTIYWGVGFYPTMLGINDEQIEARLLEQENGLQTEVVDIYSWSHEIYGVTYSKNYDEQINLRVDNLEGGQQHVFKYFCIDQSGVASGGKITKFYTLPSNYSLIKITLGFSEQLSYYQSNQIACALSETLSIPYYETISSTFSNCINTSTTYYYNSQLMYDQKITSNVRGSIQYRYFFYVDSQRITKTNIIRNIESYFGSNQLFMDAVIPYYSSMRIDSLLNAYQPIIYSNQLAVDFTSFTLKVNVGTSNIYLISGLMGKHFNNQTMSLPTHYLMKKGYFSENTRFTEIYSIYGRENISVTFSNLSEGEQYSVFYFITVDNSALNARHSKVSYIDLQTPIRPYIDLSAINLQNCGIFMAIVLLLLVY